MKVLVACEESQTVCKAFREKGHEAYSCDIQDCSGGHLEWHIKGDVLRILNPENLYEDDEQCIYGIEFDTCDGLHHHIEKWDLIIAHPPCTDLCVSGARHFEKKRADGRQRESIEFFAKFLFADCDRVAIENPVGIISGDYIPQWFPDLAEKYSLPIKPSQIIQPYQFGDPHRKTTCLWLRGLPNLIETNVVEPTLVQYTCKNGKTVTFDEFMVKGFNGDRAKHRSKTFEGIAKAMAEQWGLLERTPPFDICVNGKHFIKDEEELVNGDNYFSFDNNLKYCGSSQFKQFLKCPAKAMAILNGELQEEDSTALLIGSYVDAWFEGTLDDFKAEHPEIFKKDGTLKADYEKANSIIERVSRDELFMKYMGGKKQFIKTGFIEGVPFKIKIDSYHKGKAIVDLKVIKDFKPIWNEERAVREDFIRYWGYDYQAAIYQAVEGNNLTFYICAVTKEAEPDLAVIQIPQAWIDSAMAEIKNNIGIIQAIKQGELEAERCESCDYCRSTKKLTRVISADELECD